MVASAKRNLLAIVKAAANELGITEPTQVFGNTDDQIKQLLALANREGKEFSTAGIRGGGWQELRKEYTFSTAGVSGYTGNTTSGSAVVTGIADTTGIVVGYQLSANGVAQTGVSVVSVDSSTQITVSQAFTVTQTSVSMAFGQQSYVLPTDFAYFITQTFWDRSYRWQLLGPLDAQEWQVLKSGISPTGPRARFRIMGDLFYIDPVPTAVHNIAYEYYSNAWCQSSTGTAQSIFAADTDYYNLDDDTLILGIIWRFRRAKGLDYAEEHATWSDACQRAIARNGGNRPVPINAQSISPTLLGPNNVPDTGFGA